MKWKDWYIFDATQTASYKGIATLYLKFIKKGEL